MEEKVLYVDSLVYSMFINQNHHTVMRESIIILLSLVLMDHIEDIWNIKMNR